MSNTDSNPLEESPDYGLQLFEVVHQKVGINDLLKPLKIIVNDNLGTVNKAAFDILNECAGIVGKYIFLARHLYHYIKRMYDPAVDPEDKYFHLEDQYTEVELEVIHSLLLARMGMVKQAINTLRRSFEAAVYGSFLCTTFSSNVYFPGSNEKQGNPFVSLMGRGHWATGGTNLQLRSGDLQSLVDKVTEQEQKSRTQAEKDIYSEFTEYYLENLCKRVCGDHSSPDNHLIYSLPTQSECMVCSKQTHLVLVEKSVTMDLMIAVVKAKLKRKGSDSFIKVNDLYAQLSAYVHPNPKYHQHRPEFDISHLTEWRQMLQDTLMVLTWMYVRSMQYIGYDEPNTTTLMDTNQYDIARIALQNLLNGICAIIGQDFNEKEGKCQP